MDHILRLRSGFMSFPMSKRAVVLLQIAAFVVGALHLVFMVQSSFAPIQIGSEMVNAFALVVLYFVLINIEVDWAYVIGRSFWLGWLSILVFASGAAATTLLMQGQAAAAVGAGVMFGALVGYWIGQYADVVFGFADAIMAYVYKALRLIEARIIAGFKLLLPRLQSTLKERLS